MQDTKEIINLINPAEPLEKQFKQSSSIEALFHAYNTLAARSGRLEVLDDTALGAELLKYYHLLYKEDIAKVNQYYADEKADLDDINRGPDSFTLFLKKMAVILVFFVFAVMVLAIAYNLVVSQSDPNAEVLKTIFDSLTSIVKIFFGI